MIAVIQAAQFPVKIAPLAEDEIQVWQMNLNLAPERLAVLAQTLSTAEQERAAQWRFPIHRDHYIAARSGLRQLLSAYLGELPAALRFIYGAHGKPELLNQEIYFNVSHSSHWALYAVARRAVGVDLEMHDRLVERQAILKRVCTLREQQAFHNLATEYQQQAFFECWTRKEALVKALGNGLSIGLNNLEICLPQLESALERSSIHAENGRVWSVINLPLKYGCIGALAALGSNWRLVPSACAA